MSWRCDRCGVEVRFMDGHGPAGELPDGWAGKQGRLVCLGCRRIAVILAVDARSKGAEGRLGEKITQERRRALAEFELRRTDRYRGGMQVHGTYSVAGRTIVLSRALVAEVRRQIAEEEAAR
ncbi:MAG: hypothetical protein AABM66_12095 [Actinomycetota bacterium]